MPLISSGTLDRIQALSEDTMPDTAVFRTPGGYTLNPSGSQVLQPATEVTTKGRLTALKGSKEAERWGRLADENDFLLTIPAATAVTGTATVRVTSARFGTTKDYTIEQVAPLGSFSVHRELIVKPETGDDEG